MDWKSFEDACAKYLNKNFKKYSKFKTEGGSDSGAPDISVIKGQRNIFNIEAKMCPAQSGQFVLIPDLEGKCFHYSQRNKFAINRYSKIILNYINNDFEKFNEAGTSGEKIEFPNCEKVFSSWIIDHYMNEKKSPLVITNNFLIFPTKSLSLFFDVSAIFRIKKSGSSKVGVKSIPDIERYLIQKNHFRLSNFNSDNGKLFLKYPDSQVAESFELFGNDYMFSPKSNSTYEIRKLSKTFHLNVIFRVELKENHPQGISSDDFIKLLESY